jgi:hypothetical protein
MSAPDYVRYISTTGELWVTEPEASPSGIEIFALDEGAAPPGLRQVAFIPGQVARLGLGQVPHLPHPRDDEGDGERLQVVEDEGAEEGGEEDEGVGGSAAPRRAPSARLGRRA